MRICYLGNGKSIHTIRWLNYFVERGHDVHLISFDPECASKLKGVTLHCIKKMAYGLTDIVRAFNFLPLLLQLKIHIRHIRPDIIHAHRIGGYGWLAALAHISPLIITPWGDDILIDPQTSFIKRAITKFSLHKANLITCDGENTKNVAITLGVSPSKIKIIYFGVDTKRFHQRSKNEILQKQLHLDHSPAVISLRGLKIGYSIETLVSAIPLVLDRIPNTKFLIAGQGEEKKRLEAQVRSLGISHAVKFLGEISNELIPDYLALCDIYVSTALSDSGLAASTAEAMASGLPVIVTNSGDNQKWIREGEGGFIIPLKDHRALARHLIYLLTHKNVRETFGKVNREIMKAKHDYYREMAKVEKIYEELVASNTIKSKGKVYYLTANGSLTKARRVD